MTAVAPDPFQLAADAFTPRAETLGDAAFKTPGELAAALDSSTKNPPHLQKIDEAVVAAVNGTGPKRLMFFMPPQEGKSERGSHYTPLWLLKEVSPDLRIAIVSFEDESATRWGRFIRDDIQNFDLGLRIREDVKAAGRWYIEGHKGSVFCAGISGPLTGRPVDVLVIDDPVKGPDEADSEKYRKSLWNWWLAVARTRLAPGAIVILIMTRWHPDDLGGKLLDQEGDVADGGKWLVLRIPAVAEDNDPIGRAPGSWLPSARGRTDEEWEEIRAGQIDRWWNAMYQGRPTPAEGAVWEKPWIDAHRRFTADVPQVLRSVCMVDPSGSSGKDAAETGIVIMALAADGDIYVLDDRSLRAPSAERARVVCEAAGDWGVDEILVEEDYGGDNQEQVIRSAWREYVQATLRARRLTKVPSIESIKASGKGSKRTRAENAAGFYQQGRVHHVSDGTDRLVKLEQQMLEWTGDGDSPDRIDALSHGVRELLTGEMRVAPAGAERWARTRAHR